MILQKLIEYYDRLEADPEEDVAPYGFSRQGIHFCVLLTLDGVLADIQDIRKPSQDGKRFTSTPLAVPHYGKKRSSNICPYFLWDKAAYVLGRDMAEESRGSTDAHRRTLDRLRALYDSFVEFHSNFRKVIRHKAFDALCTFLTEWEPANVDALPNWNEISGSNLVFRIQGSQQYLHEIPACSKVWLQFLTHVDQDEGFCLVTGRHERIASLHPAIKNVRDPGGQAEKSLVTFNKPAFRSLNKQQGLNAPVSVDAAFRYSEALNRLLADRRRRVAIADATIVYWSDKPTAFEDELFGVFETQNAEDSETLDQLKGFFNRLRRAAGGGTVEDADVPFYVLGLSPNATRLSVRFWLTGTVGQFAERLGQHLVDLEIVGAHDAPQLTMRRLVLETARPKNGWPDEDAVSPLLAGALLRSVLTGAPYPSGLLASVIRRIRAEGFANPDKRKDWRDSMRRRAGILKAILIRNSRKEISVTLNPDCKDQPYQLGCLFATLERVQTDALGRDLNRTIRDGYMSSASATPGTVFPRLLRLTQHHCGKLPTTITEAKERRVWMKQTAEKRIGAIVDKIRNFPSHLLLDEQGLFFIGYYHQRQNFFKSKKSTYDSNDTTDRAESALEE